MSSTTGTMPQPNILLQRTFRGSIVLKGLHAVFECIVGITLFIIPRSAINNVVWRIGRLDLMSRNPHDLIGSPLRHLGASLAGDGRHFAALYLLSHGLVKLILVIELLRNRLWAYPLMIVMLGVFIAYQSYRYSLTHSALMMLLTIFDLAVVALTWIEYREQLRLRAAA
jgi:uncharacterized membrane protein